MSNFIGKMLKFLTWALMAVTVVFALLFYLGKVAPGTEGTRIEEPVITQSFLVWAYVLFFLTAGITVIFSIANFIANPKGAKKSLVGIGAAVVIIFVAYLLADDTVLNMPFYDGGDNVPGILKMVDTGLYTAYMLVVVAFLTILWSSVSRVFKKN